MTDNIDGIVDRTIAHTRQLLGSDEIDWPAAYAGLEKIHDGLAVDASDHPALSRLRDFIAEQDRLRRRQ